VRAASIAWATSTEVLAGTPTTCRSLGPPDDLFRRIPAGSIWQGHFRHSWKG
jgi:hypothetical protein